MSVFELANKVRSLLPWVFMSSWQYLTRRPRRGGPRHILIALADHFEPAFLPQAPQDFAALPEQFRRLERWCAEYPAVFDHLRDSDGRPFCHTYFYPAEQYEPHLIEILSAHCNSGWGEIEIQLHHGIASPDTAQNTRATILAFRDALAACGCLSYEVSSTIPRFAFVHGNWALANSAKGSFCGVDEEMKILAETGCYADFTLPSAPSAAQIAKTNSLYECALPLDLRAPHRRGADLRIGRSPRIFPLIIQGPLLLGWSRRSGSSLRLQIENGEISGSNPASRRRLSRWIKAGVAVIGRPDWVFVKLHCHGMDPRDHAAMLGVPIQGFLAEIIEEARAGKQSCLHFLTAREMVNIALAACEGREGNPGQYRDYRFVRKAAGSKQGPRPADQRPKF
jgi:hypothetical protein